MLCEICKRKEATFFIKEVILGETKTHSLCENCAKKYKDTVMPNMPNNMQIEKLIQSLISFAEDELENKETKKVTKKQKNKKCSKCGSTYDEVILSKVAGCSECYKTFSSEIDELINKYAKNVSYSGIKPVSVRKKSISEDEDKITKLRDYKLELNEAIKIEDYEKAAMLRDKIKELESDNKKEIKKEVKKETKKTVKKQGKKNDNSK